jgi:hypothetical protein
MTMRGVGRPCLTGGYGAALSDRAILLATVLLYFISWERDVDNLRSKFYTAEEMKIK